MSTASPTLSTPSLWQLYPQNTALSEKIAKQLACHPLIAQILLNRDIRSIEAAQKFLNPQTAKEDNFPRVLLDKAAECIKSGIAENKKFFVFGDYDVDGMTSTTMMVRFLKQNNAQVYFHIPHRFTEGYGLSETGIGHILASEADILILLDCGISNAAEIAHLKSQKQIDVLLFDHHKIPETVPETVVTLNPRDLPIDHGCSQLCTAGIVYKFLEYYIANHSEADQPFLMDLAALGTVADVVPLVGENRRMTSIGLEHLAQRENVGIRQLLNRSNFKREKISARDVGFLIAPRLNAAGRLTHAKQGVELLLSTDLTHADTLSAELENLNQKRREIGDLIFKQADEYANESDHLTYPILALSDESWHSGVIGIIASQLVRRYQRPVVMMAHEGTIARGSGRSVPGVDLYALLKECEDLFVNFGGHKAAVGFSINIEQIPVFKDRLKSLAKASIQPEDLRMSIDIDAVISASDINLSFAQSLQSLAPFGMGNPDPVFYTEELHAVDSKLVGNGAHLKVTFSDKSERVFVDGIGFGLADKLELLYKDDLKLVFNLGVNTWGGRELAQLEIIDIQ